MNTNILSESVIISNLLPALKFQITEEFNVIFTIIIKPTFQEFCQEFKEDKNLNYSKIWLYCIDNSVYGSFDERPLDKIFTHLQYPSQYYSYNFNNDIILKLYNLYVRVFSRKSQNFMKTYNSKFQYHYEINFYKELTSLDYKHNKELYRYINKKYIK